ncbi:site-specific integrase [Streptomyces kaniharaensis]|uniref:Site-specific integrase n=2 Tax=Streptomyces kaniharaensis TaxID=212423 RepID=A0A6N7KZ47_9ACTN|nr:site-specific integrase [Streptomyces kaniharaensis]
MPAPPVPATHRGGEAAALLQSFPPRTPSISWPQTEASREEVVDRLRKPPLRPARKEAHIQRMVGVHLLLGWLESLPGTTWQQRWNASPASVSYDGWREPVFAWAAAHGRPPGRAWSDAGLLALICADVIRPSMQWLAGNPSRHLRPALAATRDPGGFARLESDIPAHERATPNGSRAMKYIAQIVAACGGVDDIVVGDLLAHPKLQERSHGGSGPVRLAYTWLRNRGQFPPTAPVTLHSMTARTGPISPAGLIDRYRMRCRPIRDLLVDYLTERQPSVDFTTLNTIASHLGGLFWADLEHHHPDLDTLRLPTEISDAWKARVAVKTVRRRDPNGTIQTVTEPRRSAPGVKSTVRSFYLDLAQWALEEPERWGQWAAPCPISEAECGTKKLEQRQKSWSDQRTRERLPVLPVLVRTAERRLREARALLDSVDAVPPGSTITVDGKHYTLPKASYRVGGPAYIYDTNGVRRSPRTEEKHAFFAWATIEILRHTGIRIEELQELSHHSIIRYKLPTTGEVVPLLQIAPSKTDKERLLLVSPELADVLSAIVSRVRQADGAIPPIATYDGQERVWNAPMPVLYQWAVSGERRPISSNTIRRALNATLEASGLVDKHGKPLHFEPHDFRRIFITDAILNGLPPHIAQVIAGHESLNTTMGYAAIYPADAIEAHRAFIARRRQARPVEEYRVVTPEEWDEFLGHFERRKLALGECGRAYGTDCIHEHACVRCPVLIVSHSERSRLEEIEINLSDRISEAEREGWLGEVEGLRVSLVALQEKLAQLDARQQRRGSPVFLGVPTFDQLPGRATI